MPLPAYGDLIATLNRFAREYPNVFGSWYHGKLYFNVPLDRYEGAVDVSTLSGVGVEYRALHQLSQSIFALALVLSDGWHVLAQQSASGLLITCAAVGAAYGLSHDHR
jgi:hypothetical protein